MISVDDILVIGRDVETVKSVKHELMPVFAIRGLGQVTNFLGVHFEHQNHGLLMNQIGYTKEIIKRFGMEDSRPVSTPMIRNGTKVPKTSGESNPSRFGKFKEVIGALLYLSTRTRPDIAAAVGYLARDSSSPNEASWMGFKRILRYLRGSTDFGIFFAKGE